MKNFTVILSLENKKNGLEKVWKKSWILFTKKCTNPESKPLALENFKMATRVRTRPIMHCKPLSIEYVMYVYGLCLFYLILRLKIYI